MKGLNDAIHDFLENHDFNDQQRGAGMVSRARENEEAGCVGDARGAGGIIDVQLQHEGKEAVVKLMIEGNRAEFVKSTSSKLEGLAGTFEPIGNGVFLAKLSCRNGGSTQFWIFRPDGTATIREIPDRGEKQIAKRTSE